MEMNSSVIHDAAFGEGGGALVHLAARPKINIATPLLKSSHAVTPL